VIQMASKIKKIDKSNRIEYKEYDTKEVPKIKNNHLPYCHTKTQYNYFSKCIICTEGNCNLKNCSFRNSQEIIMFEPILAKIN
jgi:hypothetical protein